MLKSKLFWIALLILVIMVPFIIIWIMAGLGWAIGMLVMLTILVLLTLGGTRRRRKRYTIIDDDYDEEIIVERRPRRPASSSFDRARKLHVPTVDKKGVKFIRGDLESIRKREARTLRKIRKRLW